MNSPLVLPASASLELWGGIECTVNRVEQRYFSQLERNGHDLRLDDLQRFASLGIRALRYPVLWERTAPGRLEDADWQWPDERLQHLRELGITPILGLVHHGSGPQHTSLVDPDFPTKLAAFAGAVAARYPWAEYYTPVNEPLTTARFSALYGVWYPHHRSERSFMTALFNQCRAIVLSMRAIRAVNPAARLVQTEDLGKTWSTPLLEYQATFNNALRWLGNDLLCGMVNREHYLWGWLTRRCGASEDDLQWFIDNRCAPDILGMNHYITSERFLDENLDNYAAELHGGNGQHRYVDIEAARALALPTGGIKPLLHEAWERYQLPLAVTEVHIDARRDDQMRWLAEVWNAACEARQEGVDLRAVTVWSLLGCYDWNSLVTVENGYYEPGPFDLRCDPPRATALCELMRQMAAGEQPGHPVLSGEPWWLRSDRFSCRTPVILAGQQELSRRPPGGSNAPLLITGSTGTLGQAFARLCRERGLNCLVLSRQDMDIADPASIERVLDQIQPWALVNAAGYVRVDDAERDAERCFRENTQGPLHLAAACARHRLPLLTFSSDLVFDGRRDAPYVESDAIAPLNIYGRSKAEAECGVLDRHPQALVVRSSSFFGPWDEHNFITVALRTLQAGKPFAAAYDLTVSPTYVPDLVHTCLDLLLDRAEGIWHLSNGLPISWCDLALHAAEHAGIDCSRLLARPAKELGLLAPRPRYSALDSQRGCLMPGFGDALERYLNHRHAPDAHNRRA